MANRFSNTTTAGFKGLSLNEIMAIPLAKQAKQDASLAATDELQALESQSLQGDKKVVGAELERIRSESEAISKQLLERGTDRDLSNKLRQLRSSKKKSFGTSGVVGQAKANYASAQTYINDLATKKAQQGGWSPQEAKQWAVRQVSDFGSSFDELGNFKQFQGAGLATNVNSNDWINKNLKLIAGDTSQSAMKYAGNLNQLTQAYNSQLVSKVDFDKIMTGLTTMAANDPALQASLKQQQFFDPNAGNAQDIGKWEVKYRADGTKKKVFVPGNQFGRQLYGAAYGAQSTKQTNKYHFETDPIAKALALAGLSTAEANNMVRAADGILGTITPETIDAVKENTDLALQEVDLQVANMASVWTKEKQESNPMGYERAKTQLNDSKVKFYNLKNRIDSIEKEVSKDLTPREQEGKKLWDGVNAKIPEFFRAKTVDQEILALVSAIKKLPGGKDIMGPSGNFNEIGIGEDSLPYLMSKYLELSGETVNKTSTAGSSIFNLWGGTQSDASNERNSYDSEILDKMRDGRKASDSKTKTYLKQNPYSESYTEFTGLNSGKYSSEIGGINKMLSDGFDGAGYSEAYTGADMSQYVSENYYDPKDPAKFTKEIRVTDGFDPSGYPIEHLVIKDQKGNVIDVKSVTRGESGRKEQRQVALNLIKSSDPGLQQKGSQMLANYDFMSTVKKGLIRSGADKGILPGKEVKIKGEVLPIEWVKDAQDESWRIKIGDDFTSRELFGEADFTKFMAQELVSALKTLHGGTTGE